MKTQKNRRGYEEIIFENKHLKLNELKTEFGSVGHNYLFNEFVPPYPRPEFQVSYLKHDTDQNGLRGICKDNGFKCPQDLLWWSLVVGPDEIESAERRLLEATFKDRTDEQVQRQESFLKNFTTSPAFTKSSRIGPYRLQFPLKEVLAAYSEQFCSGAQPVMRRFRTVMYKQEVMYVVLIHSPTNEVLSDCPLLSDDPNAVCAYKDGHFIWRAEAICGEHKYELVENQEEKTLTAKAAFPYLKYYVWDNVAIALHVNQQVLKFDNDRLRENLVYCEKDGPTFVPYQRFDKLSEAEDLTKELWPNYPSALKSSEEFEVSEPLD